MFFYNIKMYEFYPETGTLVVNHKNLTEIPIKIDNISVKNIKILRIMYNNHLI